MPGKSPHQAIQVLHSLIESQLEEDLNMKAFADMANLSYHRFQHLYTELTGESFWGYVKRYRLESAAGYLRHSSWSISEIGERVGYYTKSSFSKAFSNYFNSSPAQFRKLEALPIDRGLAPFKADPFESHPAMPTHRFEWHPGCYFRYERYNSFNPATLVKHLTDLKAGENLVVTTPDIVCVNPMPRVDIGYLSNAEEDPGALKKKIAAGRYFVASYAGSFDATPPFIYQLIDTAAKSSTFSIRDHMTFVKIEKANGLIVEIWIPIL